MQPSINASIHCPVFGAFAGCAIGMILIFIESPSKVLLFLIIFLVLQQIEGNFIYPKVVGNSVGLPSIWVLVAVTTGGRLMGIIGMLIFIPIASYICPSKPIIPIPSTLTDIVK